MRDIAIDIPDNSETSIRSEVCIYKVPTAIRNVRGTAYTPRIVKIGLFQFDNFDESYWSNEQRSLKGYYIEEFLKRLKTEVTRDDFSDQLERRIGEHAQNIINFYEVVSPRLRHNLLVEMIFSDVLFILELFLRSYNPQNYKNDIIIGKPGFRRPGFRAAVQQDLLLIENQLPFKILDQLYIYSLSQFKEEFTVSFLELTCKYFSNCGPRQESRLEQTVLKVLEGGNVLHFTDVVRRFWLIDNPENWSQVFPQLKIYIPNATNLHDQAGVEFGLSYFGGPTKVVFEEKKNLLRKVGKLIMPYVIIENITEVIIRNVMVLEICYYPNEAYVCSYITLLDHLINTVEDVNLLVEAKIIFNHLGDNALLAKMINELCHQIDVDNCYYHLFQQLEKFYQSKDIRRMAALKRVYFKDTWTSTATIVAAFVIVLQIVQTFSTIWQIAHGSK